MKRIKKERFYSKALMTFVASAVIVTAVPTVQYAATGDFTTGVSHTFNKLMTTVGAVNPHQDNLTAYMYNPKTLDSSIAKYRTYYGLGEVLRVKITFSASVKNIENPKLVLNFGSGEERTITNYILGANDTESNGDDYIIFEYTLQTGDNGRLNFKNLSGVAVSESGYRMEIALPSNSSVYENDIIADTDKPVITESRNGDDIILTSNEAIYTWNLERIGRVINDVKIFTESGILNGQGVEIKNGNQIIIHTNQITGYQGYHVMISDIAGNLVHMHPGKGYVLKSVTGEEYTVVDGTKNVHEGKTYLKEGKTITITAEVLGNAMLNIGFGSGKFTEVPNPTKNGDLYTWVYTVKSGDNGILKFIIYNDCTNGGFGTIDGEGNFHEEIVADTTAPTVTIDGIYLNAGTAYYSNVGNGTDNSSVRSLSTGNDNKVSSGTVWARKGSLFIVAWSGSDETAHLLDTYPMLNNNNHNFIVTDFQTIVANKQGLCDTWNIKSIDRAGNETVKYLKDYITLICDTTGPQVSVSTDASTTNTDTIDFVITLNDPNITNYLGSGVKYMIDESGRPKIERYRSVSKDNVMVSNGSIIKSSTSENQLRITVMPENDGKVSVYVPAEVVTDNVGNYNTESNICKVSVDRTAPVITDVTGNPTDWTNEATLSVIANDSTSGAIQYSFNGGAYSENNTYKVTENGDVIIKVKDILGNESEAKIVKVTKIDKSNPTISGIDYYQGWTNQNVEVTIKASDSESGIKEYSFDGGSSWQTSPKKLYTTLTAISADKIKVKDYSGKETTYTGESITILIDKDAPIIKNVAITPDGETTGEVSLIVMAEDPNGSNGLQYSFDGNEYTTSNTYTVTKNGDITIKVKDAAGNETGIVKSVNNIKVVDTTAPVITDITGIPTDWTDKATVSVIANDAESGLADEAYSFDGGTTWTSSNTHTFESNGEFTICVKDRNGNKITRTIQITKIGYELRCDTTSSETCIMDVKEVDNTKYIIVKPKTTSETLLKYVKSSTGEVSIKNSDKTQNITGTSVVVTNNSIEVSSSNSKYVIVVKGDIYSDGEINIYDIMKLNKYRLGKEDLSKAQILAADVYDDGKIDLSDILKLNKFRLGKINNF